MMQTLLRELIDRSEKTNKLLEEIRDRLPPNNPPEKVIVPNSSDVDMSYDFVLPKDNE